MTGSDAQAPPMSNPSRTEVATLAGGCFWCTEAVFQEIEGVREVVSGYTGGRVPDPTYEQVCDGTTGHAEAVRITFEPAVIGYRELLEIFFASHDPTTLDRQGNDVGSQYRSAVFTHGPRQRQDADEVIARLTEEGVYDSAIVTQVAEAGPFYPAESYHQRFYLRNPEYGYCRVVINPKLGALRRRYAHRLRQTTAS